MGVFESLAIILGLCAVLGWVAKFFRLPPLIGYIVAGTLISVIGGFGNGLGGRLIETQGQLGVTLLLFLAGMELPIDNLLRVGKTAVVTGVGQILISASLGYILAICLGFSSANAFFVGLALTFGSTIMVVKLLSEKRELQSLHGKIVTGILLVQDFVAVGLLSVLSTIGRGGFDGESLGVLGLKIVGLFALAVFLSAKVMPTVARYLASSVELLFVSSLGWCLLVASLVSQPTVGLSFEIGGFLAGLALASSVEQGQIIARVKPLRDFFLTWFFVALGAKLSIAGIVGSAPLGIILSAFVLIANPLIVMLLLSMQGYKRRTAFLTAMPLSSMSEFSLILLLGAAPKLLPLLTLVAVVTMAISSYLVWYDKRIYWRWFGNKGEDSTDGTHERLSGHVVLFGHNRIGSVIRPALEKLGLTVVVVDFDPEIVDRLKADQVRIVYGDMADHELYEKLDLETAGMIISTVPDIHDSLQFLQELRKKHPKPVVVVVATDNGEARLLYKAGADYVLIPHAVGGDFLANLLNHEKPNNFKHVVETMGRLHKERLTI